MTNKIKEKKEFNCEICDFKSFKISNYNIHLQTNKHKNTLDNKNELQEKTKYICECGKKYKYRQGLWNHKQYCKNQKKEEITEKEVIKENIYTLKNINTYLTNVMIDHAIIKELLKETSKTQKKILAHLKITA
tara:strand:+ start:2171 stop:2569 length:399 start_codon:yes stop_codon:yes gene_type:complete